MRAKNSADFPAFGWAPTASVVVLDAQSRLLADDVANRLFGPARTLVTFRNVGVPDAEDGCGPVACGDGCGF
jgi:hypothetical protein